MLEKDILARLQNGEDAEVIANELISTLNAANAQFQKEQEEERKAKEEAAAKEKEAAERKEKQIAELQFILDLVYDFILEYYCDTDEDINTLKEAFADSDAKTVLANIEELGETIVKLQKTFKDFEKDGIFKFTFPGPITAPKKKCKVPDADEVINNFLKSFGL